VPLQPMEAHGGAETHLQPGEDPTPEQGMPGGGSDLMESPCWSRLLAGLVTLWRTHAGAVPEGLHPVGRTHAGEVHGELSPMRGTPCWSRGRV